MTVERTVGLKEKPDMEDFQIDEASDEEVPTDDRESARPVLSREMVELIPALRAFARTFRRQPSEADDLVQETLLKALANIKLFTPGTKLKSWLFTIMRNTFYTRVKQESRERPGDADCVASQPSREATQEWSVRGNEIEQAMNLLSPQQRQVLMLVAVLGISYEECANICECAVGTVKSRLNRARASMLVLLGERSSGSALERYSPKLLEQPAI